MATEHRTTDPTQKLPLYERLAACLIICVILLFTFLNIYFDSSYTFQEEGAFHSFTDLYVEVKVQGAVEEPGVYRVKKGASVADVLQLAKPLPSADLRKIKQDTKIRRKRVFNIKTKVHTRSRG